MPRFDSIAEFIKNGVSALRIAHGGHVVWQRRSGIYVLTSTQDGQRFPDTPPGEYTNQLKVRIPGWPEKPPVAGDVCTFKIGVTGSGPINWDDRAFDLLLQVGGTTGPGDVNDGLYYGFRLINGTEDWSNGFLLGVADGESDWLAIATNIHADGATLQIDFHDFVKGFNSTVKNSQVTVAAPSEFATINPNSLVLGTFSTSTAPPDGMVGTLSELILPAGFRSEQLIVDNVDEFILDCSKFVPVAGAIGAADVKVKFDGPATGAVDTVTYGVLVAISGGSGPPAPTPMGLTGTLPDGTVGTPYPGTLTLTGDFTPPVAIDASVGTLPTWSDPSVTDTTVSFPGTPDVDTTLAFTVRATDSSVPPQVATSAQSIVIAPSGGGGGGGIVQITDAMQVTGGDNASSVTFLPAVGGVPKPFTAGNGVVIVLGGYNNGDAVITGVTANGNALAQRGTITNPDGGFVGEVWTGVAGAGNAGWTIAFSTTPPIYMNSTAVERTDLATSPLDQVATDTGTSTAPKATTAATTQAKEMIVAVMVGGNNSTAALTKPAGYTELFNCPDGANQAYSGAAFLDVDATGVQGPEWTMDASWPWAAMTVTLKLTA